MTTHEERQELLRVARELGEELRSVTTRVHTVINKLIGEADALKLAAADERSAGEHITKTKIVYTPKNTPGPDPVLEAGRTGKRSCSLCREPGHQARNCPNAHKVQAAKRAAVEARPVKKPRAPMSPERRAKAVEALKKARAARVKT